MEEGNGSKGLESSVCPELRHSWSQSARLGKDLPRKLLRKGGSSRGGGAWRAGKRRPERTGPLELLSNEEETLPGGGKGCWRRERNCPTDRTQVFFMGLSGKGRDRADYPGKKQRREERQEERLLKKTFLFEMEVERPRR